MPKKQTLQQRNAAKLSDLLKQKVSTGEKGFLNFNLKKFIADELIHAANNHKKSVRKTDSLQKRYNRFKTYYDRLFTSGMSGHGLFTGSIEKNYKKDTEKGTKYFIRENGNDKEVSFPELAYKMELLAHNLSTKHDVAFTKFKPIYYLLGKGKYKIVINIPNLRGVDFDEMSTEKIFEWADSEGIEIITSDPSKVKNKAEREKKEQARKKRQTKIGKDKKKYWNEWKQLKLHLNKKQNKKQSQKKDEKIQKKPLKRKK